MVISTPLIKAYARLGQKGAAAGIGMLEVAKRKVVILPYQRYHGSLTNVRLRSMISGWMLILK